MKNEINGKIKQILIGSLLGDGSVYSRSKGTAYYQEIHSIKQKDYLNWKNNNCFKIFKTRIRINKVFNKNRRNTMEKLEYLVNPCRYY